MEILEDLINLIQTKSLHEFLITHTLTDSLILILRPGPVTSPLKKPNPILITLEIDLAIQDSLNHDTFNLMPVAQSLEAIILSVIGSA
jgi:hypothetical protein